MPKPLDLRALRAEVIAAYNGTEFEVEYWLDQLSSVIAALRETRAALEPFAAKAAYWAAADEDTMMHTERVMVEVAELNRAATVLAKVRDE
jgi:hypothetical protein